MSYRGVVEVDADERGLVRARRLPTDGEVPLGRGDGWSVPDDARDVPRDLLRLLPIDQGWLTRNGRATLRLRGPGVVRAEFDPGATLVLTAGSWDLTWDLDRPVRVRVRVLERLGLADDALLVAPAEPLRHLPIGTLHSGRREALTPTQRLRMAELFRHLLEGGAPPDNLCATAAPALRMREAVLRTYAHKVRESVNRDRRQPLRTLEELGQYLVHTARALSCQDLLTAARPQGYARPGN